MKQKFFLAAALIFSLLVLQAQPKNGYYDAAEGKSAEALRTSLYSIIKNHVNVGYDGLWDVYVDSDTRADGKVWDMYSTCTWTHGQKLCGNQQKVCDCYNREHSLPKSWWGGGKNEMYSDAFHLYPTDGRVNNFRGNMPFGECSGGKVVDNDKRSLGKIGKCTFPGYSGTVFEPDDEYKGDFARTYFYMSTCYKDKNFTSGEGGNVFQNGAELKPWAVSLFLKWHRNDPVSEKETDRNNAVEKHQRNRNPFIDYPELVEYIWGNKKGSAWSQTTSGISETEVHCLLAQNPVHDVIDLRTREPQVAYVLFSADGRMLLAGSFSGSASIDVSA